MSESEGLASGGEGTAASAPESTTPAGGPAESGGEAAQASGEAGLAPVPTDDATLAEGAAPPPPSEFVFGGRRWPSQKHAEEYLRSQAGRVPDLQRKTAEYERQVAELSQTVQALQRALSVGPTPPQDGQGTARGASTPAGPKAFADRLVESGDLQFITSLAEEKGLGHAIYALADLMGQEVQSSTERLVAEHVQPIVRQAQFEKHMGHAISTARNLGNEFPEFEQSNQSPDAVEAQQAFVATLKQFPPEEIAQNPELYMLASALITRYQHGVPMSATAPGTSGSPSARAALAAELAGGGAGPIDGSSARPRPANPQPRTAEEQFEADIIGADDKLARDLNGKPLGWRKVS